VSLVDSHCHLDHRQFASEIDEILERAAKAGVDRMLTIGTGEGPEDLDCALKIALRYPHVSATAGVHPHDAAKADESSWAWLRELACEEKVLAIGEIGLDYHYEFAPRETQAHAFRQQLKIARQAGKPIVIHTREAWDDTMRILREDWLPGTGILHCFTGTAEQALEAVELGFYLGLGGVLTFPKSESVRQAAKAVPVDKLLLETDAPYLAPIPHRGKRNEPAYAALTAAKLAEVRGCSIEEIARQTTSNFETLFRLPHGKLNGYTEGSHGPR
jgi:TatD DNase family protein